MFVLPPHSTSRSSRPSNMQLSNSLRSARSAAASSGCALASRPVVACRRVTPSVTRPGPFTIATGPLLPASRSKAGGGIRVFSSALYEFGQQLKEDLDHDLSRARVDAIANKTRIAELEQQRRILMAVGGMADDEPELKAALMQLEEILGVSFNELQLMLAETLADHPAKMDNLAAMAAVVGTGSDGGGDESGDRDTADAADADGDGGERAWLRFKADVHACLADLRNRKDGITLHRAIVKDMVRASSNPGARRSSSSVDKMARQELDRLMPFLLDDFLDKMPGLKAAFTGKAEPGAEGDDGEGEEEGEAQDVGEDAVDSSSSGGGGGVLSCAAWQQVLGRTVRAVSPTLALVLARGYLAMAPRQYRALALVRMILPGKTGGGVDGALTRKEGLSLLKKLRPGISGLADKDKQWLEWVIARLAAEFAVQSAGDGHEPEPKRPELPPTAVQRKPPAEEQHKPTAGARDSPNM
ncbi:hypothetical protein CHLRE_06g255600v5 [Chlamydomonas reinhardtii]|nr:uncharacterized protein CHLRE_06g255600v5 [Chlamydomonas reinhardtii]PNW81672.1 hypothetical protein CHLRE_06g255600v5 [Chlamydomonas reinhardtii]